MTTELEQSIGDLMDDLQSNQMASRPPAANIKGQARKRTQRRRAVAGSFVGALMVATVGLGAWAVNDNPDSLVTAAQDGTEVDPTPQDGTAQEPDVDPTSQDEASPLTVEVAEWMAANSHIQGDPRLTSVRLAAQSDDPETNGIIVDLSSVPVSPADTLTMFVNAECGPNFAKGSLILEEGNTRFVKNFLPEGVQADIGDVLYECDPPRSAQLDELLAEPFELHLDDGRVELVGSTATIKFIVSEPPG